MKNGCILCGGVGSGKSRTALAYYHKTQGGYLDPFIPMQQTENVESCTDDSYEQPQDLYIITTARKRDTNEWEDELHTFYLSTDADKNFYRNRVTIDSWNNIGKYTKVKDAFFIFDEQRVVGYGAWTQSFLTITKSNQWILLSATPGDKWEDYMPVFIANGFYKHKTDFVQQHIVYDGRSKFPKVDRYLNTGRLIRLRRSILVNMDFKRETERHTETIIVEYDRDAYKAILKHRINPFTEAPIKNISELCYTLRKVIYTDPRRLEAIDKILIEKHRIICFYNFDYERDALLAYNWSCNVTIAEWNGHKHQAIPDTDNWIYIVQYTAGCEGWNCIETDTIIFSSLNYSYRMMEQAAGRIDRLNTPFADLYYYYIRSSAPIEISINRALKEKRNFNESAFIRSCE